MLELGRIDMDGARDRILGVGLGLRTLGGEGRAARMVTYGGVWEGDEGGQHGQAPEGGMMMPSVGPGRRGRGKPLMRVDSPLDGRTDHHQHQWKYIASYCFLLQGC